MHVYYKKKKGQIKKHYGKECNFTLQKEQPTYIMIYLSTCDGTDH